MLEEKIKSRTFKKLAQYKKMLHWAFSNRNQEKVKLVSDNIIQTLNEGASIPYCSITVRKGRGRVLSRKGYKKDWTVQRRLGSYSPRRKHINTYLCYWKVKTEGYFDTLLHEWVHHYDHSTRKETRFDAHDEIFWNQLNFLKTQTTIKLQEIDQDLDTDIVFEYNKLVIHHKTYEDKLKRKKAKGYDIPNLKFKIPGKLNKYDRQMLDWVFAKMKDQFEDPSKHYISTPECQLDEVIHQIDNYFYRHEGFENVWDYYEANYIIRKLIKKLLKANPNIKIDF